MPGAAGNLAAGKFLMQFIVQSENMELPRSFCLQKANNSSGSRKSGSVPEIAEPVWWMLRCVFPSWKMQLDVRTRQDSKQW